MKAIIVFLLVLSFPLNALADCDFSKGIKDLPNGNFEYSAECHQAVGKLVADNKDLNQIAELQKKNIELKDLSIKANEQRAELWMNTSLKLEQRVNTIEETKFTNSLIYFGLGVVFTGFAVWSAGQLR